MALADPADRRVAGHLAKGLDIVAEQQGTRTTAGGGQGRLGTGMATAHHNDIKAFGVDHLIFTNFGPLLYVRQARPAIHLVRTSNWPALIPQLNPLLCDGILVTRHNSHNKNTDNMTLRHKISLVATAMILSLILVLILVSLFSIRQYSLVAAESHARTAAEIERVSLTEAMITGVIAQRSGFLEGITEVQGLDSVRVVRSRHVIEQFGVGLPGEAPADDTERQVLESGEAVFAVTEHLNAPVFRATIPYIADSHGSPNCMQCHAVKEGTVLGAITVTLSLAQMKSSALFTIAAMVVALTLFGLGTLFFLHRATRPLVDTAHDIQHAVEQSLEGHFDERIRVRSKDEIGQIASDFNQLTAFLEKGLRSIRDNVAQLIRCKPSNNSNLLTNTMEMVDGLVDAAHFKQAIEEDETKLEVYHRLARVLENEFQLSRYSIYEVDNGKNRITPILVDGEEDSNCRWCDPHILVRAETCRARRTGHLINSVETPDICSAFRPDAEEGAKHICLPIIQSGTVGSVVQLIADPLKAAHLDDTLTLLNVYLREAAPVIEAKRLTDTLRESTLRDPMTGLQNRRFLEEYMETIVAQSKRRQTQLSILMLDLDYFKKVNDTYGHDAGDAVIKNLAKLFRACVRTSDLVIRYGGEEFMIILLDTDADSATSVAEKIRSQVEAARIPVGNGVQLQKTISIGLAEYPGDSDTLWQAIKFADVALYQAKEGGRNRVIRFQAEMWDNSEQY